MRDYFGLVLIFSIALSFSAFAEKKVNCVMKLASMGINPQEQLKLNFNEGNGYSYLSLDICSPKNIGRVMINKIRKTVAIKYSRRGLVDIGTYNSETNYISLYSKFKIESASFYESDVATKNSGLRDFISCLFFDICRGPSTEYKGFKKLASSIVIRDLDTKRTGYKLRHSYYINPKTQEVKKEFKSLQKVGIQ